MPADTALLETGDKILTENGTDAVLLESTTVDPTGPSRGYRRRYSHRTHS